MNEAQKTLYYIAENMKMQGTISKDGYEHFQMAIKALEDKGYEQGYEDGYKDGYDEAWTA